MMKPWVARVLFYGGTLVLVTIMCQGFFKDLCLRLFGDDVGESLFSFIRTNVEAPISIIALAIYLDVVLARKTRPETGAEVPA